jgi:hypothetical protein
MTPPHGDDWTPSRELLAAFADGEFEDRPHLAERGRQIEAWLALHPEAAAELEGQTELSHLWRSTTAAEPSPAAWAKVWAQVEQAPKRMPPKRWPAALWLTGIAALGAAAAVLLVVLLGTPWGSETTQTPAQAEQTPAPSVKHPKAPPRRLGATDNGHQREVAHGQSTHRLPGDERLVKAPSEAVRRPGESVDVLKLATSDEVEILHISGADIGTLLVGRLPVAGPIILLTQEEIEVRPPVNGNARTEIRMVGSSPMAWTPKPNENED